MSTYQKSISTRRLNIRSGVKAGAKAKGT